MYKIEQVAREVETIASSDWKHYEDIGELGKTYLLQNKETKKYFLFDQFWTHFWKYRNANGEWVHLATLRKK